MKDARDEGKPQRTGPAEEPEADLERRQRILREHLAALARRTPEERFADIEARAVSAVRALGDELRRRRSEEDAAGFSFYRESDSLEGQAFRKLFEALTGEPLGASDVGLVDAVKRSAAAAQAVERFWEERRVPAAERDLFAPQRLAEVLREIPDAPWAPEVAFALDLWRHPGSDGPEIVVLPRADGALAVLNIGSRPTSFGEWLGLTKRNAERGGTGSRAKRGRPIAPSSGDARDNERRTIAEALAAPVLRKRVGSASRLWRSGEACALYLESFRDGLQRGPNLSRFLKETGLDVKAGTFRQALRRAMAAVSPKGGSVTSCGSSHVTDGGPDSRRGTTEEDFKHDRIPHDERSGRAAPHDSAGDSSASLQGVRTEVYEAEPLEMPVLGSRGRVVAPRADVLLDRGGDRQPRDRRGGRVRKPP
ncbi:MAG: hypothetical protein ACYDBY_00895 [Thermoanaerobaculia bacterium]